MHLIAITGSLRPHSNSYKCLKIAKRKALEHGATMDLIDLRDLNLPFCNGSKDYPDHPDVETLRQRVKNADGLIFATPEYHGSLSGVLKNAIDLLEIEHVDGKPCGLIAICGGMANTGALNTLRIICRWLQGISIPEQVIIADAECAFDKNDELIDPYSELRIEVLVKRLIQFARMLRTS